MQEEWEVRAELLAWESQESFPSPKYPSLTYSIPLSFWWSTSQRCHFDRVDSFLGNPCHGASPLARGHLPFTPI